MLIFSFVSWLCEGILVLDISYTLTQYSLTCALYTVNLLCIYYIIVIGFVCSYHPGSIL